MPKMSIVFHSGAPPLAPFLLQRRRKRYEIKARPGRDLREHSCERRGVTKVATPWMLLFFVSAGSQGGKPCPRHLCSEAESVIVGYRNKKEHALQLCESLSTDRIIYKAKYIFIIFSEGGFSFIPHYLWG